MVALLPSPFFYCCNVTKKAMVKLSLPFVFILLQQRRRWQSYRHFLFSFCCNKESDDNNIVVTFFFLFCYSAMLLSRVFCYSTEGDGLLFSFCCNKEGDGNNVVVAFFFLFCCSATKKATTVKLLSPFFLVVT